MPEMAAKEVEYIGGPLDGKREPIDKAIVQGTVCQRNYTRRAEDEGDIIHLDFHY